MPIIEVAPDHPIETGHYRVFTPAMSALGDKIADWISRKVSGAYVYGYSRLGKSSAIRWYLRTLLKEHFGGGAISLIDYSHVAHARTEGAMWKEILIQNGFALSQKLRTTVDAFNALLDACTALAHDCKVNYVAMVIDEAQDMNPNHWSWLKSLETRLDNRRISLKVFAVAAHQLSYQEDFMIRTGDYHLVARFFVESWQYPGIQNQEELAYVLQGYDEDSVWPVDVGNSYLAHYAPHFFDEGCRLHLTVEHFWSALLECLPKELKMFRNFPMKHIARATEYQLQCLARGGEWKVITSKQGWGEAVKSTDLSRHIRDIARY